MKDYSRKNCAKSAFFWHVTNQQRLISALIFEEETQQRSFRKQNVICNYFVTWALSSGWAAAQQSCLIFVWPWRFSIFSPRVIPETLCQQLWHQNNFGNSTTEQGFTWKNMSILVLSLISMHTFVSLSQNKENREGGGGGDTWTWDWGQGYQNPI